jgi:DNA mismatch repair ATPase MutS
VAEEEKSLPVPEEPSSLMVEARVWFGDREAREARRTGGFSTGSVNKPAPMGVQALETWGRRRPQEIAYQGSVGAGAVPARRGGTRHRRGTKLRVDETTVRDLELFRARDGGQCVFEFLNEAKTLGGRGVLRTRFETPLSDPKAIRDVQDGIRFLLDHEIRFSLDPRLISGVHRYLNSPYDVASRRKGRAFLIETWWVRLRYRDLVRQAREGVATSLRLFRELRSLLDRVVHHHPPGEIRRPVEGMLALLERLDPAEVPGGNGLWGFLKVDLHFRHRRKADLERLLELLSDLDALCGMARATEKNRFQFPQILDGDGFVLEGEGLFHPYLEDPVENPLAMGRQGTLVFLTGPNMAGKTTYLRAVALCVYLAHLGMGVPARELRLTPLDALFASLSPEDDLRRGISFFMAEIQRVRQVATALVDGKRVLAIFDEVFKGTNVKDALDASRMVARGFARVRTSGFLFASHLTEVAQDLQGEPSARFICFEGEVRDGEAHYEYELRSGVSDQRLGLHLLKQEGVPDLLDAIGG